MEPFQGLDLCTHHHVWALLYHLEQKDILPKFILPFPCSPGISFPQILVPSSGERSIENKPWGLGVIQPVSLSGVWSTWTQSGATGRHLHSFLLPALPHTHIHKHDFSWIPPSWSNHIRFILISCPFIFVIPFSLDALLLSVLTYLFSPLCVTKATVWTPLIPRSWWHLTLG